MPFHFSNLVSAAASSLDRHQNPPSRGTSGIRVDWTRGNTVRLRQAGLVDLDALQSVANAIRSLLEDIQKHEHDVARRWCFKVVVHDDNSRGARRLADVLHVQVWPVSSSEGVRLPAFSDPSRAYPIKAPTDRDPQHIQASLWTELAEPTYDGSVPASRSSVAFRWHWFEPKNLPPASAQDEKSCVFKIYPMTVKLLPTSESVYDTSDDYILVTFFSSEPR